MSPSSAIARLSDALIDLAQRGGLQAFGGNTTRYYELLRRDVPLSALWWETDALHSPNGEVLVPSPQSTVLTSSELAELNKFALCVYKGFYHAAHQGHRFASDAETQDWFGTTPEASYSPHGSSAFIRFAATFMTVSVLFKECDARAHTSIAASVMRWLDSGIAPLFFPPGPTGITVAKREHDQRHALSLFAPSEFNVGEFIRGNPILVVERQNQSRGCAPRAAVLLLSTATTLHWLLP